MLRIYRLDPHLWILRMRCIQMLGIVVIKPKSMGKLWVWIMNLKVEILWILLRVSILSPIVIGCRL